MRYYFRFRNHTFPPDSRNDSWGPVKLPDDRLLKDFASYLENSKPVCGFYQTGRQSLVIDFREVIAIHVYEEE